jgi:hypothetical protein
MSYTHWIRSLVARYLLALTDRKRILLHLASGVAMTAAFVTASSARAPFSIAAKVSSQINFGPNVYIFTPNMPLSQIQATVDAVATQQVPNQFGIQRYALLFEPGTYGSSTPLKFSSRLLHHCGRPRPVSERCRHQRLR